MQKSLPLATLAAALALAACNQAPKTTDNAMVNVAAAADVNSAAFNDEAPVVEEAGDAAAVAVVAVPRPVKGASADDSAPLTEAGTIEDEIRSGSGVERIRYGDGWAWRRNGAIVRTADRDGRNVAYFRGGAAEPFFVQQGDRAFAYRGNRPVRSFGSDGRGSAPDAGRARDAEDAFRKARDSRDRADHARDDARRGPPPPAATPVPSPTPSATGDRDHGRGDGPGRHARPTPTPQPSPSPTSRWRQPQRTPGDHDHN